MFKDSNLEIKNGSVNGFVKTNKNKNIVIAHQAIQFLIIILFSSILFLIKKVFSTYKKEKGNLTTVKFQILMITPFIIKSDFLIVAVNHDSLISHYHVLLY